MTVNPRFTLTYFLADVCGSTAGSPHFVFSRNLNPARLSVKFKT